MKLMMRNNQDGAADAEVCKLLDSAGVYCKNYVRTTLFIAFIGSVLVTYNMYLVTEEITPMNLLPLKLSPPAPSSPQSMVFVAPFSSYSTKDGIEHQRSCKKTIVVKSRRNSDDVLGWEDQPFPELQVDDISNITALPNNDILCLQVGSTTGAVGLSNAPFLLGLNAVESILHLLENTLAERDLDTECEVIDRKSVIMSGWYPPTSPQVRERRSKNDNTGNHIWAFGATRMINPYTVEFKSASTDKDPVSAAVVASANALHMNFGTKGYEMMKNVVNSLTNWVRKHDRPTIVLGIGIQANFDVLEDIKSMKLAEHQLTFMNEVAKRNTAEKSVSVRGELTETVCANAGAMNCISLGCPSLTISRAPDLGQVLETKWNDVVTKLKGSDEALKIGIGLPALFRNGDGRYERVVDMILSICEKHDCHYIAQAPYDKSQLISHAKGKVKEKKVFHFKEGVERWFEFMRGLDVVASTRIHGGMAGISNGIPTVIVPTDLRILELINAMELPHVPFEEAMKSNFTSLAQLMVAAEPDFKKFERNRRSRIKYYKGMLESIGLEMDPALVNIISNEVE